MTLVETTTNVTTKTHLILKDYKDMINVMLYLILLNQVVNLGEIVPMVEME